MSHNKMLCESELVESYASPRRNIDRIICESVRLRTDRENTPGTFTGFRFIQTLPKFRYYPRSDLCLVRFHSHRLSYYDLWIYYYLYIDFFYIYKQSKVLIAYTLRIQVQNFRLSVGWKDEMCKQHIYDKIRLGYRCAHVYAFLNLLLVIYICSIVY